MSSASAVRIGRPTAHLPLVRAEQRPFTYECRAGSFNARIFFYSALGHVAVLFLLPTFAPRVIVSPAFTDRERLDEVTLYYTPSLPEIESTSQSSKTIAPGTQGTQQQSPREVIRAISSNRDPVPLLAQTLIATTQDSSQLASVLPVSASASVNLAPEPIEVPSGTIKDSAPALVSMAHVRAKMASLPSSQVRVDLAPQPIEIRSERDSSAAREAPTPISTSVLPTSSPKLPLNQATVRVRQATFIPGGTTALKTATGSGSPLPATGGGVLPQATAGGIPDAALVPAGAVVLNPTGGSAIGSEASRQGRIAAAPDGVPNGQGLASSGGGRSNRGAQGLSSGAAGLGPAGRGNVGKGDRPGAGASESGSSAVAITGVVINLGSFGPSASGPLRGRRPAVVVVSSAAAGGALQQFASRLKGQTYTIYLNTSGSTAVMQFAQSKPDNREFFAGDLVPPESITTTIPQGLQVVHQVVSCVLTTEGKLKNIRLLIDSASATAEGLTRAIESWQFRPAYRGDAAVEVNVLLGFGMDTD